MKTLSKPGCGGMTQIQANCSRKAVPRMRCKRVIWPEAWSLKSHRSTKRDTGESGTAKVTGSATITTLRIDHLLSPGEIRRDGSVKFFEESHGALLVLAEVKDGQAPLTDQMVYWQSRNSLGSLSQNSVRTDEHGQALVK